MCVLLPSSLRRLKETEVSPGVELGSFHGGLEVPALTSPSTFPSAAGTIILTHLGRDHLGGSRRKFGS